MATQYEWFHGMLDKTLDAQATGEYLESLVEKYNSKLTVDEVIADAKTRTSPLHKGLTWDDPVAADKWRRKEAKTLLNALTIKDPKAKKKNMGKTRAFVFVHVPGYDRKVWMPLKTAMQDAELKAQVIETALHQLTRWMTNWGGRRELGFVAREVERLRKKIEVEYMTASGVYR